MFKINLIPEVKQEQLRLRKLNLTVTSVAVGIGVVLLTVSLILLVYVIARNAQISSITKETEKVNQELEVYKDLEKTVINLENGLKSIKQVLSGDPKWSKFFVELEKVTPNDVQINSLSIQGGKITMALTGKDVASIDRFVKSFTTYKYNDNNLFANIVVNGYSTKDSNVSFQATMDLVGGLLW